MLTVERVLGLRDTDVNVFIHTDSSIAKGLSDIHVGDGRKFDRKVVQPCSLIADRTGNNSDIAGLNVFLHRARRPHANKGVRSDGDELL